MTVISASPGAKIASCVFRDEEENVVAGGLSIGRGLVPMATSTFIDCGISSMAQLAGD